MTSLLKAIRTGVVGSVIIVVGGMLTACAPEVGSKEWCADLKETPKGDWTANQASDYAKHCIF